MRAIPIHNTKHSIGSVKSNGIPFFHAFTGCGFVSAFRGKGKRIAWDVYPEASEVFAKLSTYPPVFGDDEKKVPEQFVIIMYNRSSSATDIDSNRKNMFARKQKSYYALSHKACFLPSRLHLAPSNNSSKGNIESI